MPKPDPRGDDRASLHGLTPEEALRALLAVDPTAEPLDDENDDVEGLED